MFVTLRTIRRKLFVQIMMSGKPESSIVGSVAYSITLGQESFFQVVLEPLGKFGAEFVEQFLLLDDCGHVAQPSWKLDFHRLGKVLRRVDSVGDTRGRIQIGFPQRLHMSRRHFQFLD